MGCDQHSRLGAFGYPILQNEHLLRLEAGMDFFRLEHDDYSESEIVGRNLPCR